MTGLLAALCAQFCLAHGPTVTFAWEPASAPVVAYRLVAEDDAGRPLWSVEVVEPEWTGELLPYPTQWLRAVAFGPDGETVPGEPTDDGYCHVPWTGPACDANGDGGCGASDWPAWMAGYGGTLVP